MLDKIKQFLCKHKETQHMEKISQFQNLNGQRIYTVCKKCKKVIGSNFYEYEGNGWK